MAFERTYTSVAPQAFTADGTVQGVVKLASTFGFKVKAQVVVQAPGLPVLTLEVKRVLDVNTLFVGPPGPITARTDLSAYTIAAGSFIYMAEQPKAKVGKDEQLYATYDQEPTVAWRTVMVDQLGQYFGSASNPIAVQFDGTIAMTDVRITALDNDPVAGRIHSSVRISDGTNSLKVNADGSINAILEQTGAISTTINRYAEVLAVASGTNFTINTYTCPIGYTANLQRVSVSGENIARYDVKVNGTSIETRRTYWSGGFNTEFNFLTDLANGGYLLNPGDIVTVVGLHNSPYLADFEARIQAIQTPM